MKTRSNRLSRFSATASAVVFLLSLVSVPLVLDGRSVQAGTQSKVKRLINKERKKRKRPRLKTSGTLRQSATAYSRLQKSKEKTGHEIDGTTPGERATASGFAGTFTGEAIANAPTAELAVGFWKKSNEHRKIILNRKAKVGGFGKAGRIWTAMFGNNTPPPAP